MEAPRTPRLLDLVSERCRVKHFRLRTEQAYIHWIRRYILFHGKRHPRGMGGTEVESFLTHLAVDRNVSPSTHNQAHWRMLFLYRDVPRFEVSRFENVARAKKPYLLPCVPWRDEVRVFVKVLA